MSDLDDVERELESMIDRYRGDLVDATIYGMPSLAWPGAAKHDYFVSIKRSQRKVSLYLKQLEDTPEVLDEWPSLQRLHTGKVTLGFSRLDDDLRADLQALLDQLHREYLAAHR